jgi:hypothetical protein
MREERLAQAFVEFSDTLVRDYDVVEFLSRLCQRSVEVLEVTAAGALLTDGARRLQVVAASTEQVTVLETLQIQRQEGPCVDAYRSGRRVAVPDLRRVGRRWPVLTPPAHGAGVSGVCAFPMRLRTDRIGALNVFQATPGALDEAAVDEPAGAEHRARVRTHAACGRSSSTCRRRRSASRRAPARC